MYGIDGQRRLTEFELPWLPGYEGSKPVRVGNAASGQFQLDVYGEVMSCIYAAQSMGLQSTEAGWRATAELLAFMEKAWQRPDDGIWEVRGGRRHFTHSKVMAWVAIDRVARAIRELGLGGDEGKKILPHVSALAERIHAEVCDRGFNPRVGAFTQSYGSAELDASILVMPHFGFLPGSDPRVKGTVAAVEKTLLRDGFVLRYETDSGADGLPGIGGRVPGVQLLAGRQLRVRRPAGRSRGAVRAAAVAAQPPGSAVGGIGSQAAAPDRQLPAGVLAPRADHDGADHRIGVAEAVLDPTGRGGQRPGALIARPIC